VLDDLAVIAKHQQLVDLMMSAMKLSAQIQMFEMSAQAAIAPHEDFSTPSSASAPIAPSWRASSSAA